MLYIIPYTSYVAFIFFFTCLYMWCSDWMIFVILSSRSLIHSSVSFSLLFIASGLVFILPIELSNFGWFVFIVSKSLLQQSAFLLIIFLNSFSLFITSLSFKKIFIYLFIWLHQVLLVACRIFSCGMRDLFLVVACELLVAACRIQFPDQGWNPGPLHWKRRVLTTGPWGKSLLPPFQTLGLVDCFIICSVRGFLLFFYWE